MHGLLRRHALRFAPVPRGASPGWCETGLLPRVLPPGRAKLRVHRRVLRVRRGAENLRASGQGCGERHHGCDDPALARNSAPRHRTRAQVPRPTR